MAHSLKPLFQIQEVGESKGFDLLKKKKVEQETRLRKKSRSLIRLLGEPSPNSQKSNEDYDNELCLYDGVKLRSYDITYITWLLCQDQFKFQTTTNVRTGMITRYQGIWEYGDTCKKRKKAFEVDIHLVPGHNGWAVDFSGSVHMWSNRGKHNYNDFYWIDFLRVYDEMVAVFQFDPAKIEVVNLEVGVNCVIPEWMKLTICQIKEHILYLFGMSKSKLRTEENDRDSHKEDKGGRYLKAYDKSIQHRLKERILRLELGYQRARPLFKDSGVIMYSDLREISNLFKFKQLLKEVFEKLHMYQPELRSVPIEETNANPEIFQYGSRSFWADLKKEDPKKYKKARLNQERLIKEYCSYNLAQDIRRILSEKLE